jgi:hypothetical protein
MGTGMTDEPWGARGDSPADEDAENTGGGDEQQADEEPGTPRRRENKGSPAQPWSADEQRYADTAEQAGQQNLSRDPPVPRQRTGGDPGPTDITSS